MRNQEKSGNDIGKSAAKTDTITPLQTEEPIAEKDKVKQAEEKLRKLLKGNEKEAHR